MFARILIQPDGAPAIAALGVVQGAVDDRAQLRLGQRFELKDARARNQRANDLEVRVLGRRADQGYQPGFHVWQQRVLLRLVPAVNLIHKQDRALAVQPAALPRFLDHAAQFGYAGQHRRQFFEMRAGMVGDQLRQGRFAGSRRAKEDDRAEQPVGFNRAAQGLARPDDVLLSHKLVQRKRAHALRQRRFVLHILLHGVIK